VRSIDCTHASRTDLLNNSVVADGFANHGEDTA